MADGSGQGSACSHEAKGSGEESLGMHLGGCDGGGSCCCLLFFFFFLHKYKRKEKTEKVRVWLECRSYRKEKK